MKFSELIDALKSFFLDFLGYFLPGIYAIILLGYFINPKYQFNLKTLAFLNANENLVILLFAYIVGYAIYSIDLADYLSFEWLNAKSSQQIEQRIKSSFRI